MMSEQLCLVLFLAVAVMMLWMAVRSRRTRKQATLRTSPRMSSQRPSSQRDISLKKIVKKDDPIASNQVTLVTWYDTMKDEFLGIVEVLDGHLTGEAATSRSHPREAVVLKQWMFLGFGDRFDAKQRGKDFGDCIRVFDSDSQRVIQELRGQGWTVQQSPQDPGGNVYHLTRPASSTSAT